MSYLSLSLDVLAGLGIAYLLASVWLIGRYWRRARSAPPEAYPAVTVVKPLHGDEPGLHRRLRSMFTQDYPAPVQYVFGTRNPQDPALAAVAALRREFPGADVSVVVDARRWGSNNKVSNLANMMPVVRNEFLIFSDSDVEMAPDGFRRLADALLQPRVGAVSCLYVGDPEPGFWPGVAADIVNYDFIPGVMFAESLRIAEPCLGPTMALRRSTLQALGGWPRFGDLLAEDFELGVAVRRLGLRVALPAFTIKHACQEATLPRLVEHQLRWNRTIFAVDPWGFAGSVLMHPLVFALAAVAVRPASAVGWAVLAAAGVALAALKWRVDRTLGVPSRSYALIPLRELLSFALFVATFCSSRVAWRGSKFDLDRQGRIQDAARPAAALGRAQPPA